MTFVTPLAAGDIYESAPSAVLLPGKVRVLLVESAYNNVVLYSLPAEGQTGLQKKGRVFTKRLDWFEEQINNKLIVRGKFEIPIFLLHASEESIPDHHKEIRSRSWRLIRELVEDPANSGIYDEDRRGRLINSAAAIYGTTPANLYRLLNRYWTYGCTENALLPHYPNSGLTEGPAKPGSAKRGRPNLLVETGHDPDAMGVNVGVEDAKIFEDAVDVFHVKAKLDITHSYNLMLDASYSETKASESGELKRVPKSAHLVPTLDQFRYCAKKLMKKLDRRMRKLGQMRFSQKERARTGRVTDKTRIPTETYEIDATVANVWLVSRFDRQRLVGKVVVYFVVDRATGMIVGMHTALEGPSWNAARYALYWSLTDKVEYCARYGVTIISEDWPCQEACQHLVSDFGEIQSGAARDALQKNLNIISQGNAHGRPDRKPLVESRFRFVAGKVEWVPGGYRKSAKEWREDTGRDPRFDAVLDIEQFTRILIWEVLDHNNNQRVPHLLTAAARRDNVEPYRRDIYVWGLRVLHKSPRRIADKRELYIALLPKENGSITVNGLHFKGSYYLPSKTDPSDLLSQARYKRIPVEVHSDPNMFHRVHVRMPDTKEFEEWYLPKAEQEKWADCRFEDVEEALAYDALDKADNRDRDRSRGAEKRAKSAAEVDAAKEQKRSTPKPATKKSITSGVRNNRAAEQSLEHKRNDLLSQKGTTPSDGETSSIVSIDKARQARRLRAMKRG